MSPDPDRHPTAEAKLSNPPRLACLIMAVLFVGIPSVLVATVVLRVVSSARRAVDLPRDSNHQGGEPGQPQLIPIQIIPGGAKEEGGWLQPTKKLTIDLTGVRTCSLSPDGGIVGLNGMGKKAEGGPDEPLTAFYDLSSGKRTAQAMDSTWGAGQVSAGGKLIAYNNHFDHVVVRDTRTGKGTKAETAMRFFALAPDGTWLVTANNSKITFHRWPPNGSAPTEVDSGSEIIALSRMFLRGTRIAAVHNDEKGLIVRVWDVQAGRKVDELPLNRPRLPPYPLFERLRVAEDGRAIFIYSESRIHCMWDLTTKKPMVWADEKWLNSYKPISGGRVYCLDWGLDTSGKEVQSLHFITVADFQTGKTLHRLLLPAALDSLFGVEVDCTPDGKRFVAMCDPTHELCVWDLPN